MTRTNIIKDISQAIHRQAPTAETILFGSQARGDARPDSDIDILILLDDEKKNMRLEEGILDSLYAIELEKDVEISPIIITKKQWNERPFQTPFSINIKNEGIAI